MYSLGSPCMAVMLGRRLPSARGRAQGDTPGDRGVTTVVLGRWEGFLDSGVGVTSLDLGS